MSESFQTLGLDRGLVIRQPHIGNILAGVKTWEMRSTATKIRGRVGLIEAGSGLVIGEAEIVGVEKAPSSTTAREASRSMHQLDPDRFHLMDKWCWAWVLKNAKRFSTPIPYVHPKGAVIWVKLSDAIDWQAHSRDVFAAEGFSFEGWITETGEFHFVCRGDEGPGHSDVARYLLGDAGETEADRRGWLRLSDYGHRCAKPINHRQQTALWDWCEAHEQDYREAIAEIAESCDGRKGAA